MIDALIFDMDGTIVDSMPHHEIAWRQMLQNLGVTVNQDEFFAWSTGLTNKEIFPRLLGRTLAHDELARLAAHKEWLYRESYQASMQPISGFVAFITAARASGVKTALGTAAPPENITLVIDGLKLRKFFPVIVGGADVARGKPDPEVFLRCAAKLGAAPERTVVFEDSPAGIEAAYRAGMRCVAMTTTLDETQIRSLPNTAHLLHCAANYASPVFAELLDPLT